MASKHGNPKVEPQCTVSELETILTFPSGGMQLMPSRDMDEVYPGVYIGDGGCGKHIESLQKHGITHVLNTAKGNKDFYHINTDPAIYRKPGIQYLAIEATDMMTDKLDKHFDKTANFIEEALQSGGKVLVHCCEGFSRSATIVLAFLLLKRHMSAQAAVRAVREHREVGPNDGFLQQLCDLNQRLWLSGHFTEGQTGGEGGTQGQTDTQDKADSEQDVENSNYKQDE